MSGLITNDHEFRALIQALCDNRLSDVESSRLGEILQGNEDAQCRFMELVSLDTSLHYWVGLEGELQRQLTEHPNVADVTSIRRPITLNGRWMFGLAVALAGCFALGWLYGTRDSAPIAAPTPNQSTQSLPERTDHGMLVAGRINKFTPESEWLDTNLAIMRGTYVRPGQLLELERGAAEIQLASGATVILQGPVKFEVNTGKEVFLYRGKIAVACDPNSKPLTLSTPSTRLEMRAGEVGATVDDHGVTDVQVLSGTLSAGLINAQGDMIHPCSLSQGAGMRFDTSTELVSKIGFTRYGFVRDLHESFVAYHNYKGSVGNQDFEGSLGMDFVVKDPVEVTKLGVFDSGADGLKRTLHAELWSRDESGTAYRFDDDSGIERIAEMSFTPQEPGLLVESSRFKPLPTPIVLSPGAYTIVASGYGAGEPNGNEGNPIYDRSSDQVIVVPAWEKGWHDLGLPIRALKGLDDGDAAILFVGSARWDEVVGQFPRVVDSGAVNRFQSGTFEFQRIDPGTVRAPEVRDEHSSQPKIGHRGGRSI